MPADASSPGSLEPGPSSDRDIEVRELLELEMARIDWNNRQVALNERTFALEEARDQREFQFATATRDANVALRRERLAFLRRVTWSCVAFAAFLISVLLGLRCSATKGSAHWPQRSPSRG